MSVMSVQGMNCHTPSLPDTAVQKMTVGPGGTVSCRGSFHCTAKYSVPSAGSAEASLLWTHCQDVTFSMLGALFLQVACWSHPLGPIQGHLQG